MRKHGMGFSKAMELVKSQLPQASPNFGFISQLQQFEKSIKSIYMILSFSITTVIKAELSTRIVFDTIYSLFWLHAVHDEDPADKKIVA